MASAYVRLEDVVIPELFTPYDSLDFLTKNAYIASGVAFSDPEITQLMNATRGGQLINLPFWNPIGEEEAAIASDDRTTLIETRKITSGAELAFKGVYTAAFSASRMAGFLAGSDPMTRISAMVDKYWIGEVDSRIINASQGLIADSAASHDNDLILDITGSTGVGESTTIDADAIIDARGLLGDYQDQIGMVLMHSVVYTQLQKQQLIEYVRDADNNTMFATFNGMRVMYTDKMPTAVAGDKTAYYTYMFGPNVFSVNFGYVPFPQEIDRNPAAGNGSGEDVLYTRRSLLVHPRGYAVDSALFTNTSIGISLANLASAGTWTRVYTDRRRIPFVAIKSLG